MAAAVSFSSWESLLDHDGLQTSRGVLEMYSFFTYESLRSLSLRILMMMKE